MHRYILLSILISLVLILLGMPRGFDISDEGLYALLAVPSQENVAGIFNYDLFFKLLHKVLGVEFGLIGLRILRLLSCFVSAYALMVFWNNFTGSSKKGWMKFLISLCGVFASYGFLPQTLSYNSINLMCGCLWLAVISYRSLDIQKTVMLGFILALLFYSKITVCFLLGFLTLIILWRAIGSRKLGKWLIVLAIPLLIVELVFFGILGDSGILRALEAERMLHHRSDYQFPYLVKYTAVGAFWTFIIICPFFVTGYLAKIHFKYEKWSLTAGIIIFLVVCYWTTITDEVNHLPLLATAAAFSYYLAKHHAFKSFDHQAILLVVLIIFPFILHFGSNVYFLRLGIHYWVFWILALLFVGRFDIRRHFVVIQLVVICSLLLVINGVCRYSFENYDLLTNLEKWEYRKGNTILLPSAQVAVYRKLTKEFEGYEEGILPIYRNPGLVYMIGRVHPKTPGLWSRSQMDYFFPNSESIDIILYNDTFTFPYKRNSWTKSMELELNEEQIIKVFWKK